MRGSSNIGVLRQLEAVKSVLGVPQASQSQACLSEQAYRDFCLTISGLLLPSYCLL